MQPQPRVLPSVRQRIRPLDDLVRLLAAATAGIVRPSVFAVLRLITSSTLLVPGTLHAETPTAGPGEGRKCANGSALDGDGQAPLDNARRRERNTRLDSVSSVVSPSDSRRQLVSAPRVSFRVPVVRCKRKAEEEDEGDHHDCP